MTILVVNIQKSMFFVRQAIFIYERDQPNSYYNKNIFFMNNLITDSSQ